MKNKMQELLKAEQKLSDKQKALQRLYDAKAEKIKLVEERYAAKEMSLQGEIEECKKCYSQILTAFLEEKKEESGLTTADLIELFDARKDPSGDGQKECEGGNENAAYTNANE